MKWIVCYADKSGDTSKVWTEAETQQEAIDDIKSEYWDIDEIIYAIPM